MSIPVWPATLPQYLNTDGYNESPAKLNERSPMDVGPAKVRRRSTAGARPVKGKIRITKAQLAIFESFYNNDLAAGSLRFQWTQPTDDQTIAEMRFTEEYGQSTPDGINFDVSMSLEILP